MTTLDPAIYRKAAHVIATGGLAKGTFSRPDLAPVPHCTVGALMEATGERWTTTARSRAVSPPRSCTTARPRKSSTWATLLGRSSAPKGRRLTPCRCTVGALQKATGQRELYNGAPEVQYLGHLLGLPPDGGCGDNGLTRVTRWNDRPETTADDVITLLEQAAEKLEANQP
jgi:hypothetical protein